MSDRRDQDFLRDIHQAVQRIATYTSDLTYEAFLADTKTQDAVIRNLEIIGEQLKTYLQSYASNILIFLGKGMAGIRDRLIHHYFGVNLDIVWQIVDSELSEVALKIEKILRE